MRSTLVALCLVCGASVVQAQATIQPITPQGQSQQTVQQPAPQQSQQPQQQSEWGTQFSAQNWSVAETRVDPHLVHFEMKMKRFYSGGMGEPRLIIERRANALVRAGDFASYQLVEYNESLESFIFGSQRIVEATIRLMPKI